MNSSKLSGQVSTGTKRNPAYIIADDDKAGSAIIRGSKRAANLDTASPTIASIEALQERFPTTEVDKKHKLEKNKVHSGAFSRPITS